LARICKTRLASLFAFQFSLLLKCFCFPQTINALGANSNGFDPKGRGPPNAIAFVNIYELFDSHGDLMVQKIRSNLDAWAASQAENALNAAALREIFQVQAELIKDKGELGPGKICTVRFIYLFYSAPVLEVFYREGDPA
jgi:hypothetical protein